MTTERMLQSLSDDDLLRRLEDLTHDSRRVEAELVAHIGEVDKRRLYARQACPSIFVYCIERLHLSEAEAFLRIGAARAAREHPVLLEMLADGRIHLSGIALLAPHLTADNRHAVLSRAVHRSKREIAELVAELAPRPDVAGLIRRLPASRRISSALVGGADGPCELRPDEVEAGAKAEAVEPLVEPAAVEAGARPEAVETRAELRPDGVVAAPDQARATASLEPIAPARVEPIAPARYKVQFTAGSEFRDKLERLRRLMRPTVPDGDLATIIEAAVSEKLAKLEARRFGSREPGQRERGHGADGTRIPSAGGHPRTPSTGRHPTASRHLPAAVRRAVRLRDGEQCAFRDAAGRRCSARERLEFHHRRPFAHGGGHCVENVALLCREHNAFIAELDYGRVPARRASQP